MHRLMHFPAIRLGAALLAASAWSGPAFCGPIHDAAKKGDLARVQALLTEDPALVSSKDKDGNAPLHWAAGFNHKDVAELLLAKGADVNAKNNAGWTPLHQAAHGGYRDVAELLLAKGANVSARNGGGWTPLHLAAAHRDVAELLLAKGAKADALTGDGATPLHIAANLGRGDVAELLLAKGANVNARTGYGDTPLHLAAAHRDVTELLLAKGADVNAKNNAGWTPLHQAADWGQRDVAELLLASGADVNARNSDGHTPLRLARGKVAELLREHGGQRNAAPSSAAPAPSAQNRGNAAAGGGGAPAGAGGSQAAASGPPGTPEAKLSSGGMCTPDYEGGAFNCHPAKALSHTVIVKLDGKTYRWTGRGGHRSFALTAGRHTLTVQYENLETHKLGYPAEVWFVAELGHSYRVESVDLGITRWLPVVFDVTDENQQRAVSPLPRLPN